MKRMTLTLTLVLAALCVSGVQPAWATHDATGVPFATGDVFAGAGTGKNNHFSPTGTLKHVLDTGTGSLEDTGMCFDPSGNLYTTQFQASSMTKFNTSGNILTNPWGGPFSTHPETCVADNLGNVYTGEVDGANQLRKFDTSGTLLATFSPATEDRGIDWIDLSADKCTMLYTSEGSSIKRFDVCTNTQLSDFATGLPTGRCFALRIRSNGEVLVACLDQINRLSPSGSVIQTYPASTHGDFLFFAMNLDPDNTTFWTAGYSSGMIHRIDISTGAQVTSFSGMKYGPSLAGLAVFGEPQQGGGGGGGGTPCTIKITNGGWIVTDDVDRAGFGGIAKETSTGVDSGSEEYQDHGPADPMNVHSLQITDVTCDNTGTQASIFGTATVDGTGSHPFQIDVQDNGEPGKGVDHYRMRIPDIGYDSGDHILRGGNVQIH